MLQLDHIHKTYEDQPLLTDISFTVAAGETVCLLGASGSGKSTLLRMIAGLESPDAGHISFNGLDLTYTPPHRRDFGLVFQDYSLFPHLSVNENVAFGLQMRRKRQPEIAERVASMLRLVNLENLGERKVTDLSGGEQQRVALARALAVEPRLLMFDEPLGALDKKLKDALLRELRSILHQTRIPAVYVTHDQEEAFAIADRIMILHNGQIVRAGSPADVWAQPGSKYVAEFLGLGNVIDGQEVITADKGLKVVSAVGEFIVACGHTHTAGDQVHLLVRPVPAEQEANILHGAVADFVFQQDRYKVTFENGMYVYWQTAPKLGAELSVPVRVECLA